MEQKTFDKTLKPVFLYMGFIASVVFSVAYIIVISIMILGLELAPTIETFVGFLVANLATGACIAVSLMIQGQDLAKDIPENKKILESYYGKKETKVHSIGYYWFFAILKLILTRLVMIAGLTYIVIDICWQGNGQYTYFLVAIFNILMFLGFGSLGMVSMYDKYNNRYIPWLKKQIANKESTTQCLSTETKISEI